MVLTSIRAHTQTHDIRRLIANDYRLMKDETPYASTPLAENKSNVNGFHWSEMMLLRSSV